MMILNIKYFAKLRELSNKSEELYDTQCITAYELYYELKEKYSFSLNHSDIKVAVNEEYVDFNYVLKSKDTVVFIPPVAGG
jgi:molybdopterin converting factor subunit 1